MLRKLREVAAEIGISYPTLKQWIYQGKIRTVKTVGGHHRVPEDEFRRLTGAQQFWMLPRQSTMKAPPSARSKRVGREPQLKSKFRSKMRISGRNKLRGKVREIEYDGLLARIVLDIGHQSITAIITREASQELDLKVGDIASALIKATEVMILK